MNETARFKFYSRMGFESFEQIKLLNQSFFYPPLWSLKEFLWLIMIKSEQFIYLKNQLKKSKKCLF